ncbi:uracil-DNA glycosylase [Lacimicrobium sp. SS2-24]|uniref:uracil-DNA glycosylase n=1 Tax=Lacimicrobium sp. SS2-24 TaxID=2005569 RepID=UPI000B4BA707|nr:uracil-DNA glycosylase [Lacimicrobium sp. SS2-24]
MDWQAILGEEKQQPYFQQIIDFVSREREAGKVIYPPQSEVFNAFKMTSLDQLKVVILGQDPYHGPNQAHGLCFSVQPGIKPPPSLVNIYKELARDVDGFSLPAHGCLQSWAQQGVLLLNTVLTVEQGNAHSHAKIGWERFTDKVIEQINRHTQGVVFLLWGSHAQKKGKMVDTQRHLVLKAPHPSPLSAHRGFLGCGHFSMTNEYLLKQGKSAIDWRIE